MTGSLFTLREAARYASLPHTTVDYLCRSGVLAPSGGKARPGRGRKRLYTFGDVVCLRALSHLLAAGIPVAKLKRALRQMRKTRKDLTPNSIPGRYLVTDGRNVYFKDNALEDLTAGGQLTFAFVIQIEQVCRDVEDRIAAAG